MKLDNTMVIVANQSEVKEYHIEKHEAIVGNELKVSYSLFLHHDIEHEEAREPLKDVVSDEAGRFGHTIGEEHNLENERKKRSIQEIAEDINTIIEKEQPRQLFLAFPQEVNAQLLEKLSAKTKEILVKNVPLDLVKKKKEDLLSHFDV